MLHKEAIVKDLRLSKSYNLIARKIYIGYPTNIFIGREDMQFDIFNQISEEFKIPLHCIQVTGSSKTGFSYFKNREFIPGESDLDIAIISLNLFNKYSEFVFSFTKGYSDLSKFPVKNGVNYFTQYTKYLARGIFRPDLMPMCKEKTDWFTFFNTISSQYYELFKSINAGIYASQYFFEYKQADNIQQFAENEGGEL